MEDDYGDSGGTHDADLAAALEAAERAQGATATATATASSSSSTANATAPVSGLGAKPRVVQPTPQKLRAAGSAIIVNTRQKGNPILTHIKNVPWEYGTIVPDYIVGASTCALFLSLKYHRLHPEYLQTRLTPLRNLYTLRLLLVLVDIDNHADTLRELTRTALHQDLTLLCAWSAPEAGRYLETYKMYEHAAPTAIMERQAEEAGARVVEVLTTVRSVNRTDAVALVSNFGTVKAAVNASREEVLCIQGWGEKKVAAWERAVGGAFRPERGGTGRGRGRGRGGSGDGSGRGVREKLGIGTVGEELVVEEGWVIEDDEEALRAVAEMEAAERREREKEKGKGKEKEVDKDAASTAAEPAPDEDSAIASGIMDALTKLRERGSNS